MPDEAGHDPFPAYDPSSTPPSPGSAEPGWWYASDGRWYPPSLQHPPAGYLHHAATAPPSTNGMAIASLVLGILWIYWIGSILALIFGYIAKAEIRRSRDTQPGSGLATAGIVLGWIGVGLLALVIVVALATAGST
jgi:hypothetical protein